MTVKSDLLFYRPKESYVYSLSPLFFYLISNVASGWVSDLDLKSVSNSFSFSKDSVPLFIYVAWYQNHAFLLDLFL